MATRKHLRFAETSSTLDGIEAMMGGTDPVVGSLEAVPLALIRLDPGNPRKLGLSIENPRAIAEDDPLREAKLVELAEIEDLSKSIASQGLLMEVGVFRSGPGYQLAWGERRVLACRLLGHETVNAKVLPGRPETLAAKRWVENMARRDFSFAERINGLDEVVAEAEVANGTGQINAQQLADLGGVSHRTARRLLTILRGPSDLREAINAKLVTDINVAEGIAAMPDVEQRKAAIAAAGAADGGSEPAAQMPPAAPPVTRRAGRPATKVSVKLTSPPVIRYIVEHILTPEEFDRFRKGPWDDLRAAGDTLNQALRLVEKRVAPKSKDHGK